MAYEWSNESEIATINSGDSVNFVLSVDDVQADPLGGSDIITPVTSLQFESIGDPLPESVVISENDIEVTITGEIDASALFESLAYSVEGKSIPVDQLEDIPFGANVHKMIPERVIYKYYDWRIFSTDFLDVEREFRLTVIVSWDGAKASIIQKVSEIIK